MFVCVFALLLGHCMTAAVSSVAVILWMSFLYSTQRTNLWNKAITANSIWLFYPKQIDEPQRRISTDVWDPLNFLLWVWHLVLSVMSQQILVGLPFNLEHNLKSNLGNWIGNAPGIFWPFIQHHQLYQMKFPIIQYLLIKINFKCSGFAFK